MKKRFLENLTLFLALNLLIKTIYVFGIDRVVQNTVGTEIYGSYFPLFNLVLIFQIFLDLGIENFTRKEIAHNPGLTKRLFSSFLLLKIVLIIVFISIFSIVGYFLPHNKSEFKILFLLLINQSMANLILYLRANLGGLQMFKVEGVVSVLDRFFMILFVGLLLIIPSTHGKFKIEWFVVSQTFAYGITLIFSLIILVSKTGRVNVNFNWKTYPIIFKKLGPFALLTLLMAFYYRIDSVFLRYFLPDGREQAGIYAHGFRILDFMSNYALIFALILLPTFAKHLREKEDITSLLRLSVITLIVPSFAFLISVVFYRYQVFQLLYNDQTAISAQTFTIFTLSFAGICISYTYGALLTANGNLRQLNIMAATAVIISIVLNSVLIPRYKVMGAAATNAITQLYTVIFHITVVKKQFKIKFGFRFISKIAMFFAFTLFTGYIISQTKINWLIGLASISFLSIVFAFAIKLMNLNYVTVIFKGKNAD